MRRRPAVVFMTVALWAAAGPVRAEEGLAERSGTYLKIGTGYAVAGNVAAFAQSTTDVPTFTLGVTHRFLTVDVGAQVGHVLSGRFTDPVTLERPRYGGQFYASVLARWRFVNLSWGAFLAHFDAGVMVFEHTHKAQRALLNDRFSAQNDRSLAKAWTAGFVGSAGLGLLWYLTQTVDATLQFRSLMGVTSVPKSGTSAEYLLSAFLITFGVEIAM